MNMRKVFFLDILYNWEKCKGVLEGMLVGCLILIKLCVLMFIKSIILIKLNRLYVCVKKKILILIFYFFNGLNKFYVNK